MRDYVRYLVLHWRGIFFINILLVNTARCYAERGISMASCLSVCLSVCNVEVSWSYRLEFLENNFTADYCKLSSLCGPQHHGSTPKGTPPNFSRNRSGA